MGCRLTDPPSDDLQRQLEGLFAVLFLEVSGAALIEFILGLLLLLFRSDWNQ
jgi:hypothetical protein